MVTFPEFDHPIDSSKSFERFFDISPDLLCIAGFDGYFKKINHAVTAVLEYSFEELYSRPINDFVYIEDKEKTAQARSSLTRNTPLLHFENRYVTKSGKIIWLAWTSMPIEEEGLVFAIAKNITSKKNLEEERNLLLANVTRTNNRLKQLSYTTSHDLRAPVNNVLAIFSILDTSTITDHDTLACIDMLKSATEGLKHTLNNHIDLLSEKEEIHTHVEEINLEECLQMVLFSIHALVESSNARIQFDFSETNHIQFNKAYMESIFLNLLTNSIKYARPACSPEIVITTKIENGNKQLVFADNGLGFEEDFIQDKIFGLHQKLHHHHDSKGIGLYLVHNHITSLGGKIKIQSKVGEGSTFIFSFADKIK